MLLLLVLLFIALLANSTYCQLPLICALCALLLSNLATHVKQPYSISGELAPVEEAPITGMVLN
jgi:hypothetical protein